MTCKFSKTGYSAALATPPPAKSNLNRKLSDSDSFLFQVRFAMPQYLHAMMFETFKTA